MRGVYFACGLLCLTLGFAGIFLPLLPTTPLVLLAAFCFSKSSERMHRWLIEHPRLGPTIRDWQENRVIRPKTKGLAAAMIVVVIGSTMVFGGFSVLLKTILASVGAGVILLICSYPSGKA